MESESRLPGSDAFAEAIFACVIERDSELVLVDDCADRLRETILSNSLEHVEDAVEEVLAIAHFLETHKKVEQTARDLVSALDSFIGVVVHNSSVHPGEPRGALHRSHRYLRTLMRRPVAPSTAAGGSPPPKPGRGGGVSGRRHNL